MRRPSASFDATVRAFREMTAASTDAAATRARVLARAGTDAQRRVTALRVSLAFAAALVSLASASAAWITGARLWRAPAPVTLEMDPAFIPVPSIGERPRRIIPAVAGDYRDSPGRSDGAEARAYGRAHLAHFVEDLPARALRAWDDYLDEFPQATFAPEARYNRALCLVRLGRLVEAARALRPFAQGAPKGYRCTEARILLDWLHDRLDTERLSPGPDDSP
jgi:hypothetical protein